MKNIFLLSLLLSLTTISFAQERDILWLSGPSGSSSQWHDFELKSRIDGYQLDAISDLPYGINTLSNDIPFWATSFNDRLETEDRTNTLGIGHDIGGLILRYMDQLQAEVNLSAMILVGTPNQGGRIYNDLLPRESGEKSDIELIIENLLDRKTTAEGCIDCNTLVAANRWLGSFTGDLARDYYQQVIPGSETLTNLGAPRIPTAVIWGNTAQADGLTLTRLLGSWHDASGIGRDNSYLDCQRREINQIRTKLEKEDDKLLFKLITGLAKAFGKFKVEKNESPVTSPSIYTVLGESIDAIFEDLDRRSDLTEAERELAECELIHQAMNASWNLAVAPYEEQEDVFIPCVTECELCGMDGTSFDESTLDCLNDCSFDCIPGTGVSQTFFVYQPHDGLYTRDEQLLTGADKNYEARKVNHFQEQWWEYQPIATAFQDLFTGGAGDAFRVPD